MVTKPRDAFTCRSSTLAVWVILTRFMGYYSPILGSGVILTVTEPRGTFTCRSSTLAVLGDSDPFHGLLLTDLGIRSDFHGY